MESNNMELLRKSKKLSFLELSRKTGVSERYLRFIEKGEKTPSIKTAFAIAQALGTSVDNLFN